MEPIFGVMSMYDVACNDQGELAPDLYMERASNLGKKYGFVPTAITFCDRDNLGLINDTGNWLIEGEDPLMQTLRFRDRIVGVHLKDYRLEEGCWRSVALGRGMVDMERVIRAMWDLPKPYRVLMPTETDLDGGSEFEAQEQSLAYLREVVDRIKSEKA